MSLSRAQGFSLVELVVAILLVGILAAFIFPRILNSDIYNAITTRDQLLSVTRAAQQRALGRSDVRLQVQLIGDRWHMILSDNSGELQRGQAPARGVNLAFDVNQRASCGALPAGLIVSAAAPLEIEYQTLGQLLQVRLGSGGWQAVTDNLRICVNNQPAHSLCLDGSGFAYAGDCDD